METLKGVSFFFYFLLHLQQKSFYLSIKIFLEVKNFMNFKNRRDEDYGYVLLPMSRNFKQ